MSILLLEMPTPFIISIGVAATPLADTAPIDVA